MTSITCNKCFQIFEFTDKQQMFFAEKGFPPPKKCKKCKDFQKNKKVYTYTPSQKELELKEQMKNKYEQKSVIKTNSFSGFNIVEENEPVVERIVTKPKMSWADMVEEEEEMNMNSGKSWANVVKC